MKKQTYMNTCKISQQKKIIQNNKQIIEGINKMVKYRVLIKDKLT